MFLRLTVKPHGKDFCFSKKICVNHLLRLFTYIREYAAVDIEYMPVNGVGGVGGEEHGGTRELVRFEPAACGRLGADERIKRVTGTVGLITETDWTNTLLIGGLCGVNDRGQLLQCYAYGNVVLDCRQMSNGFYLGGLCGYSGCFNDPGYNPHVYGTMDPSEDAIIQDCVAFGNVSLIIADTENDPVAEFGGLIGRDDGVIGNSYRVVIPAFRIAGHLVRRAGSEQRRGGE